MRRHRRCHHRPLTSRRRHHMRRRVVPAGTTWGRTLPARAVTGSSPHHRPHGRRLWRSSTRPTRRAVGHRPVPTPVTAATRRQTERLTTMAAPHREQGVGRKTRAAGWAGAAATETEPTEDAVAAVAVGTHAFNAGRCWRHTKYRSGWRPPCRCRCVCRCRRCRWGCPPVAAAKRCPHHLVAA